MLNTFLQPVSDVFVNSKANYAPGTIGSIIDFYLGDEPKAGAYHLALLSVPEERGADRSNEAVGHTRLRNEFFNLYHGDFNLKMIDLGTLQPGKTLKDTRFALEQITAHLIKLQIIPIIIGGSNDLAFAQYAAYSSLETLVDMVVIDSRIDIEEGTEITSSNYLYHVIAHQPAYLFNLVFLGYQTYLNPQEKIQLVERLFFDSVRLGELRDNIHETEPFIRSADLVAVDLSAINKGDANAIYNGSPNGLHGHELCQMAKYAGINEKLTSFGIYEYAYHLDDDGFTAQLIAQTLWYFIDGFYGRMNDWPSRTSDYFIKYITTTKDGEQSMTFYKSRRSDRWWMEVPMSNLLSKYEKTHLVPCSYNDYQVAVNQDLPDKWWRAKQRLGNA